MSNFKQVQLRIPESDNLDIVSNISHISKATLLMNALKYAFLNPSIFGVDSMTASRIKTALQELAEGK